MNGLFRPVTLPHSTIGSTTSSLTKRSVLLIALLFIHIFAQMSFSENRIRIETIVGEVEICGSGSECREARIGMSLHPQWYIRTSKESHVVLRFANGTIMKIDEQSIVSLSMYRDR